MSTMNEDVRKTCGILCMYIILYTLKSTPYSWKRQSESLICSKFGNICFTLDKPAGEGQVNFRLDKSILNSNNMRTIITAFWLAESMSIYSKQCKNVKLRVQRLEIDAFWTRWEWIILEILKDHMSSLSFSTNEVIVNRACELPRKLINSMTEIIVCILWTGNHMISRAILE